jgi:hypothetical protein
MRENSSVEVRPTGLSISVRTSSRDEAGSASASRARANHLKSS